MPYTPANFTVANWSSPITIVQSDLIKNADDAFNAIISTDTNSVKNWLNTHISTNLSPYLVGEFNKVYTETNASAVAAASSASSASTSATTATAQATSATASATSATASATAAASSATASANSATSASGSATTATTKAGEASTSATNAASSATSASGSATSATASATSASTSATTASTKAAEAAASALSINPSTLVYKDSDTGAAYIPSGTTAQRPVAPASGYMRFNTTLSSAEVWNGTMWTPVGGGATGGGADTVFVETSYTVTQNYTLTTGKSAMTVGNANGDVTINDGITVTIPDGSQWNIVGA